MKDGDPRVVRKYVITSFQPKQSERNAEKYGYDPTKGAVNKNLIKGLESYCGEDGELIYLSMNGMDASEGENQWDSFFKNNSNVYLPKERNIKLNKNCIISDDIVPPQNMDPSTSRDRIVQGDQTRIYAHSKQRFKSVAAGNARLPKLLITTGTCTHPNYNETNHIGDLAKKEHKYGAVVVEILDNSHFNVRHIEAQKNGVFADMGYLYDGRKKKRAKIEALVLGDIHWGDHDPRTIIANDQMLKYFKPKRLFLHDFMNGHSVNPHERDNMLSRAMYFKNGRLSIETELRKAYKELTRLAKNNINTEINLVHSNHGFFLDRYMENKQFVYEPWNLEIALKLSTEMLKDSKRNLKDPVEAGLKMIGKIPANVKFLQLSDDYRVWGWQLASHGHRGISGARGSVKSHEVSFGKSITGHIHAPERLRNTVVVGTSTRLDLPYTDGSASRWMAANAVLYEGGLVQLLPVINGRWRK